LSYGAALAKEHDGDDVGDLSIDGGDKNKMNLKRTMVSSSGFLTEQDST
jgi:hypothetical protein